MTHQPKKTPLIGKGANDFGDSPLVNILMVDDSPDKLLAIESVLSDLGQNLVKANSGEEALRLLLKQEFALILLDVNMPGIDGFETASLIRQRQSLEHIPIIFVTALSTTDAEVFKGYSFGAVDYILTPIIPEILRTKVGVFVELYKQQHELKVRAEALCQLNERLAVRAQQLATVNRELESFCYTIAHDLRAPLRAMEGLTSLLLEDYSSAFDLDAIDYGTRIRTAAARMDQMIQELLSYSRLTLMNVELQPISLSKVIKDVVSQISFDLEQKGAVVKIKRSNHQVMGHYTMLAQVILNLIVNAVKFVPSGKPACVKIRDEKRGDYLRVYVEDNGIGIAKEHQERIFRIFERLHSQEQYTGTGIGLAIVEKAVHRMNGKLGLESTLGEGSTFWFELQLYQPENDSDGVPSAPPQSIEPANDRQVPSDFKQKG
ncbi:MAG: sensor histidine kinase [Verrucomicrobiales bacterium]